jgi:23S rRNA pseudouridine1911/1915/1917 synthase
MSNPQEISQDYSADESEAVSLEVAPAQVGLRLDQVLAQLLPEYSRSRLQAWVREGLVLVDGRTATVSQRLQGYEQLTVFPQPDAQALAFNPEVMALDIVFEDQALIVLNKPPGLVVHPASGNWSGTLLNGLLHHHPALAGIPRAGIVHRLDKDTSGLMVVAKTLAAQTSLVRQLQTRTVKREYLAIVEGIVPSDGKVDSPIGRHPSQRTKMAVVNGGKEALTRYEVLERLGRHTLLRCRLETGRTHQIRVHMQSIAFALLGDAVYGGRVKVNDDDDVQQAIARLGRQALHAARLAVHHPVSNAPLQWEAALPEDMRQLLETLRRARDRTGF